MNGWVGANIVALPPSATESIVTPMRSSASANTGLPAITPIEPVIVPGCATMASAAIEIA